MVREDTVRYQAENNDSEQRKHDQMKELVQKESRRLKQEGAVSHETIVRSIQLSETAIISSVELGDQTNQAEHTQTQNQIAELKESIRILADQIEARDLELKQLLTAFNNTKNATQRRKLGDQSNAVTAALLALEIMYSTLMVSIILRSYPKI